MTPDEYSAMFPSCRVLAILDTMWGETAGDAPPYFRINPNNHSGRRLYSLCGSGARLLVTNACRELVTSAKEHGKPDPEWLADNLTKLDNRFEVLLVCGKVAQDTFRKCGVRPDARVIEMPHPAARFVWTPELISEFRAQISVKGGV